MARKSIPKSISFPDFKEKIEELRGDPKISQQKLAKDLGVSQTQVSAWLSGQEKPSAENLITMSKLAASRQSRLWFLRQARVNVEMLKADFRDEIASTMGPADRGVVSVLPVIKGFWRSSKGYVLPRASDEGELHISAEIVGHPGSTVGMVIQSDTVPLESVPFPLNVGDMALVDQTQIYPSDFIEGEPGVHRLAVLLFPRVPEWLETGLNNAEFARKMDEAALANLAEERRFRQANFKLNAALFEGAETRADEKFRETILRMERPMALLGHLFEQRAGRDVEEISGAKNLWRLFFSIGPSRGIALTDWIENQLPRDVGLGPLLHNARIFGAVVGWLSVPAKRRGEPSAEAPLEGRRENEL